MKKLCELIEEANKEFKKDDSILAVFLFGSYGTGKANRFSDFDIAVLFDEHVREKEYSRRQIKIMNALSRVLRKEVDVVVLNRASLFLRYQVLKEGRKIFERGDRREHAFETQAIVQYLDFLPLKNRMEKGMLSKIKRMRHG